MRELVIAVGLFALATLVLTYPLAVYPASRGRLDNGDARLNAWAISWVAHQSKADPLRLFDANTFHPLPRTLAFSEHLIFQGLMARPLLRLTDDLTLTFNVILLFSMFLSAVGMYVLTVSLTGSHLAGVLTGIFFSFAPFRFNRLPHLQVQLYAFLPLALACFHRFLETGRRRWAAGWAAFLYLQVLSGTYLAAIAAVAAAIALVTLSPGALRSRASLKHLAVAIVLLVLAIYPIARPYLWVHRELGIEWDLPGIGGLAALPQSYLASSSHLYRALGDLWLEGEPRDYLFPGLTLLVLGGAGAVLLAAGAPGFPRPRRTAACYVAILLAGVVLSLGPATPVYSFLYDHVVFFRGLRALTRFGLLPLFSLSVLSGFALARLFERWNPQRRRWTALAISGWFVFESTALPYSLHEHTDEPPEVYRWLAAADPGPIVELPFRVVDTRYMFWARHHGFRPTLNGDSGFVPLSHQWMKVALLRFPSPDSIALLKRLSVRYVVLHLGAFRQRALVRMLNGLELHRSDLLPVRDFGRHLVFEVLPDRSGAKERQEAHPLPASGSPAELFDSDRRSSWKAGARAAEIEIRLEEPARVSGVRIHYGPVPRGPIGSASLLMENPSGGWKELWSTPGDWPALTELVLSLLERPREGAQQLVFPAFPMERVRLRVVGYDDPPEITEIEVLGAPGSS